MEVKSVSDYYYKHLLNAPYLYVITEADSIYLYVLAQGLLLARVYPQQGQAHGPSG